MDEKSAPDSPFANIHNSYSILARGKKILLGICVIGFVLIEWNILQPEWIWEGQRPRQIILSILVLLATVIILIIFETNDAVSGVSRNIASLRQTFKGNLNLVGAMEDLSRELKSVKPGEKIIMCHLALNLEQSWNYLKRHFLEHRNLRDIEVYLLMLPKDHRELKSNSQHPVPTEVENWCGTVEKKIKAIERDLNDLKPVLGREGRKLKVLIKHYRMVPIVHGYSVFGHFRYSYFSLCRWVRGDGAPKDWAYDWGEDDYHKFVGDPNDLPFGDLAKFFEGHFHYLWATSGKPSVQFYHGVDPDTDHSKVPRFD